jgi:hypothetical protein
MIVELKPFDVMVGFVASFTVTVLWGWLSRRAERRRRAGTLLRIHGGEPPQVRERNGWRVGGGT